ncbi:hypothetical protein [Acinetobacter pittii]|uniref:hypothetical protein n=1 Tax=Acinetobacter pittii TaxID=48296 RepID=UPI000B11793B|nr:hypothetical protein [Acinetobacter pittii]
MGNITNLSFKQLTVVSNSQKSANQFKFHPKYNLITGNNNSIGKSTLAKLLLWTLGCSTHHDPTWKALDIRTLLVFNIGDNEYSVGRYNDIIYIKQPNENWQKFEKITGAYSKIFAEIVKFKVLLPNKADSTKLETPPPAYYFLPFYIDQECSWTQTWNSFSNLQQYASWKPTVIKYHTGYINDQYFEILEKISKSKFEKNAVEEKVKTIETSINIINEYLPSNSNIIALTKNQLEDLYENVNLDLTNLQKKQEDFFKKIAELNADKIYFQSQLDLASIASKELDKDYLFSVENIEGENISCPICGTEHANTLINRASILADKAEADAQIRTIKNKLSLINKTLNKNNEELAEIEREINLINSKYDNSLSINKNSTQNSTSIIEEIATSTIHNKVQKTIEQSSIQIKKYGTEIRSYQKEQNKLLTKEEKNELNSNFKLSLSSYIEKLDATAVNLSNISSSLDYNKMHGNGGAAESTRGLLAYYYAVLKQIHTAENEIFAPIIIDTPNQQEQADFNYSKIINFIEQNTPDSAQLIICAMNRDEIKTYKDQAHTIFLTENKLLDPQKYTELKELLNFENYDFQ